ncbi:MAG: exodeoxyribonuclease VII large subunit [Candidatus Weimeria sp.]
MNKRIYTVSVINHYVAGLLEDDMLLRSVSVTGEVSNLTYHSSGHIYFTLKDDKAAIKAVMFRTYRYNGLKFQMKAGDKVVVTGSIGVYEKGGMYQLYAERIEPAGEGELAAKVEALKKELRDMGMFDAAYKKPVPKYCFKIGVVTAPTGAVIHDIMQVSERRNPHVQILLAPASVQGESAADSVARALARLDQMNCDVIICGRGGGSLEDLMAFNTETVARAIFSCNTPVISAVGHETDTTIADYVADLRAPTPSAAAELAVFSYEEFLYDIRKKQQQLDNALHGKALSAKNRLLSLQKRIIVASPKERANRAMMDIMKLSERMRESFDSKSREASDAMSRYEQVMKRAFDVKINADQNRLALMAPRLSGEMAKKLSDAKHTLSLSAQRLELSNPVKKIAAGFAYVSSESGRVTSVTQIKKDDIFSVRLKDGTIEAQARKVEQNG